MEQLFPWAGRKTSFFFRERRTEAGPRLAGRGMVLGGVATAVRGRGVPGAWPPSLPPSPFGRTARRDRTGAPRGRSAPPVAEHRSGRRLYFRVRPRGVGRLRRGPGGRRSVGGRRSARPPVWRNRAPGGWRGPEALGASRGRPGRSDDDTHGRLGVQGRPRKGPRRGLVIPGRPGPGLVRLVAEGREPPSNCVSQKVESARRSSPPSPRAAPRLSESDPAEAGESACLCSSRHPRRFGCRWW